MGLGERECPKLAEPVRDRVPRRGALADWPVVAVKPRNGGGVKGLGRSWFICLINRLLCWEESRG